MLRSKPVSFEAKLWLYEGFAAWHFVTLPKELAEQIILSSGPRRGFGSLKVKAQIAKACWETSIFPDKKSASFLLPVKAEVRKKAKLLTGQDVLVTLQLLYT